MENTEINMQELIKLICVKRKITLKELATRSGQTGQNLYNKMNRNDWKQSELKRVLDVLNADLKIEIIDRETGKPFTFM